jgi:glycosyltransferase involved in cell wall biosynthesis
MIKVTIITVVRNCRDEITGCIESVLAQAYKNIEYIVIDGASTDGTLEIFQRYQDRCAKIISEKDAGPYDAMNKGLKLATGDIIGFLHADDLYAGPDVIADVVKKITEAGTDSLFGDLVYVQKQHPDRLVRYWRSGVYREDSFRRGWMPPHPAFFAKREIYERLGGFDTRFSIAADYELLLRFLYRNKISTVYLPEVLVKMREGGISNKNLMHLFRKTREDLRIGKIFGLGWGTIFRKNLSKLPQFFWAICPPK